MTQYKFSRYSFSEKISPELYIHYSSLSNQFILANSSKHLLLTSATPTEIQKKDDELFNLLIEKRFLVETSFDETQFILNRRQDAIERKDWYNVVVNTTLDCNLDCWYCYENKVAGSRLSDEVVENISHNISAHFDHHPFDTLKLSFFGGEPFMDWKNMIKLIEYGNNFCNKKGIKLILDFTTNATLINAKMVDFLAPYTCYFQITLDGAEETHNQIKRHSHLINYNSYQRTLNALRLINSKIPDRLIALRINFDNRALEQIDSIIRDISFLDRRLSYVIVKKVWQVDTRTVDKEAVLEVIQKLFDHDFLPDYYIMPKGGVCFAERENQVLFNYDGKIFKCTTICSFDDENSLGTQDNDTGLIIWDEDKIYHWLHDNPQAECINCKWFGACLGVCNKQLMLHKNEFICTFDAMNLTQREYLMYLLKYNLLYNKLHHSGKPPYFTLNSQR